MINYEKFAEFKKEVLFDEKTMLMKNKFNILIDSLDGVENSSQSFMQLQHNIIGFKNQLVEFALHLDYKISNAQNEINTYNTQFIEKTTLGFYDDQVSKIKNIGLCLFSRLSKDQIDNMEAIAIAKELRQLNSKLYDLSLYLRIFDKKELAS